MPAVSKFRKKQIELLKERARLLYEEGRSLRDVGMIVGKSYQWVHNSVREKRKKVIPR